jgi:hypothetical protein
MWCLVRDLTQTEFPQGTAGLVERFESGFLESSVDDLIKFMKEHPNENTTFAILDERSMRDKTVAIHSLGFEMPDDVPEGEWDEEKAIESWKIYYRVPFASAAHVAMSLENQAYSFIQHWGFTGKKDNFVDEEGVLQLPSLEMKDFDMLDDEGWPA